MSAFVVWFACLSFVSGGSLNWAHPETAGGNPLSPPGSACRFCKCDRVYLDVGSNIGVQVRKLFEPSKFPKALVKPVFEKYFGSNRSGVCAIGFEPNPLHTLQLMRIQESYRMKGWYTHFYTRTAVSTANGVAVFNIDNAPKNNHWGSSLVSVRSRQPAERVLVSTVNLADFILNNFSPNSTIVMKLDIEGGEFSVLPSLILSGALCALDCVLLEWHDRYVPQGLTPPNSADGYNSKAISRFLQTLLSHYPGCKVKLSNVDDETYHNSGIDKVALPNSLSDS
eukprot:CAMPEP_0177608188 /NCGR_PEP_ID=MMETSP0419_2-20121207/18330_1 /TAXON_ID=582737 /ORGANISM="Tetraselmis sp., Strain GSL018" /LENGTH=281 /DNA_ID=CAMNT_0019102845 /DNA_START=139 /DNA_END=984 /DNA_ORIENTATION=+